MSMTSTHSTPPADPPQPTPGLSQGLNAIDLAFIAVFAALITSLGFFTIPVGSVGVPIVLQNSAILLTAMLLGGLRGGLATTLFLALGLVGIPNLAGGRSTLAALSGVSVGYLLGYLLSAFLVGYLAQKAPWSPVQRSIVLAVAALLGLAVQYLCGSVGLVLRADMAFPDALLSNSPYIAADLIETLAAVAITLGITRAVPDLVPITKLHTGTDKEQATNK